jgi:hypothetical protein
MSVRFVTRDPQNLLNEFKAAVKRGDLPTWRLDAQEDFRHVPGGWDAKAWWGPTCEAGSLLLTIGFGVVSQNKRETFGVLTGRIIEPFVSHMWRHFEGAKVIEMPSDGDYSTA